MKWSSRIVIAACLGLSYSVGTCSWYSRVRYAGSEGTGTVGTNGLDPCTYSNHKDDLTNLMKEPLLAPNTNNQLSKSWGMLTGSPTGRAMVEFLIECIAPNDMTIHYPNDAGSWTGKGLLDPWIFKYWNLKELRPHEKLSVHTCLAAHMNSPNEHIKVWMEGDNVAGRGLLPLEQWKVLEGYWATFISEGRATTYYWPPNKSPTYTRLLRDGTIAKMKVDMARSRMKAGVAEAEANAEVEVDAFNDWTYRLCSNFHREGDEGINYVKCPIKPGHGLCTYVDTSSGCSQQGCNTEGESHRWMCAIEDGLELVSAIETRLDCCDCCNGLKGPPDDKRVKRRRQLCEDSSDPDTTSKYHCSCNDPCITHGGSADETPHGGGHERCKDVHSL